MFFGTGDSLVPYDEMSGESSLAPDMFAGTSQGGPMRTLWTVVKVVIGLAVAIPLGIAALAISLGILGGLLGLAVLTLKLACVGFIGYGLFRLARGLFGAAPTPSAQRLRELPPVDPYYEAAMRELDTEMRVSR